MIKKIHLGITDQEAFQKADRCMELGLYGARVVDAVSYTDYMLKADRVKIGGKVDPRDLSAGLHTSAGVAEFILSHRSQGLGEETLQDLKSYISHAKRLNNEVRNRFILETGKKEKVTPGIIENLRKKTDKLMVHAASLLTKIRGTCSPPAIATLNGRRR
jgi:hypothetical protein